MTLHLFNNCSLQTVYKSKVSSDVLFPKLDLLRNTFYFAFLTSLNLLKVLVLPLSGHLLWSSELLTRNVSSQEILIIYYDKFLNLWKIEAIFGPTQTNCNTAHLTYITNDLPQTETCSEASQLPCPLSYVFMISQIQLQSSEHISTLPHAISGAIMHIYVVSSDLQIFSLFLCCLCTSDYDTLYFLLILVLPLFKYLHTMLHHSGIHLSGVQLWLH